LHLAAWNGEVWSGFGTGVNGSVVAVAAAKAGVFVAGLFDRAGNDRAAGLAHWDERPASVPDEGAVNGGTAALVCWPNPFTSRLTIEWSAQPSRRSTLLAAGAEPCSITIHDMLGRVVAVLFDGVAEAGRHTLEWNAEEEPAGMYICRLSHHGVVTTCKLILVK
jgi:hypothetical protein